MKAILINILFFSLLCDNDSIIGRWGMVKNIPWSGDHYPDIEFMDKSWVIVRNYADTVYYGDYVLKDRKVSLSIADKKEELKILLCKNDTLILCGFRNVTDTITYIKRSDSTGPTGISK